MSPTNKKQNKKLNTSFLRKYWKKKKLGRGFWGPMSTTNIMFRQALSGGKTDKFIDILTT